MRRSKSSLTVRSGAHLPIALMSTMCKHLLIATDGSQASAKALAQGLALAKASAIQVTVVTVTEPWTERAYATMPTLHDWFMRRPRLAMRPLSSRTSNRNLDSRPAIPCRGRHEVTGANRLRHAALGKGGRRCAITEHHTPGLRIEHLLCEYANVYRQRITKRRK